jgi:hypothetical protein
MKVSKEKQEQVVANTQWKKKNIIKIKLINSLIQKYLIIII